MPLTILDVDEAESESEATIAEWEREFREQFTAPMLAAQRIIELLSMPPEAIEWLKVNRPDDFARANRYIRQLSQSVSAPE
jgi:hypothetical protein